MDDVVFRINWTRTHWWMSKGDTPLFFLQHAVTTCLYCLCLPLSTQPLKTNCTAHVQCMETDKSSYLKQVKRLDMKQHVLKDSFLVCKWVIYRQVHVHYSIILICMGSWYTLYTCIRKHHHSYALLFVHFFSLLLLLTFFIVIHIVSPIIWNLYFI